MSRFTKRTDDLFGSNNWGGLPDDFWGQRMSKQVDDYVDDKYKTIHDGFRNFGM